MNRLTKGRTRGRTIDFTAVKDEAWREGSGEIETKDCGMGKGKKGGDGARALLNQVSRSNFINNISKTDDAGMGRGDGWTGPAWLGENRVS